MVEAMHLLNNFLLIYMLFDMMDWILLYMKKALIQNCTTIEDNFEVDMIHSMLLSTVSTSLYVTSVFGTLSFSLPLPEITFQLIIPGYFKMAYICPLHHIVLLFQFICKICTPALSYVCPTRITPYLGILVDFSRENRKL